MKKKETNESTFRQTFSNEVSYRILFRTTHGLHRPDKNSAPEQLDKYCMKKLFFFFLVVIFQFSFSEYRRYYIDLNKLAFDNVEEHLLERVKRGMAQRYTYRECYLHWLKDFKIQ